MMSTIMMQIKAILTYPIKLRCLVTLKIYAEWYKGKPICLSMHCREIFLVPRGFKMKTRKGYTDYIIISYYYFSILFMGIIDFLR